MKRLLVIAAAMSLAGCATVTRGTTNQVSFESVPEGAAVQTTSGHACAATPCMVEISRKTEFVASFSKSGYQNQSVTVNTRLAGAGAAGFAGNVLVGGIVGMGVDAATGSTLEHYPNPVKVELVPLTASKARKARKPRSVAEAKPTS